MKHILRFFAIGAIAVAIACATSQPGNDFPGQTSGTGPIEGGLGNGDNNVFGTNGDATLGLGPFGIDAGSDASIATPFFDAAGLSLTADGAVVGTCVVGRTCDPTCDELVENGVHEYTEMAPDDGSQLPPTNVAQLFTGTVATAGGPPCITEPPDGSLYPNNWLRPRIAFTPGTGETYFQIRIHADRQQNDLVVYTGSKTWKIPADIWKSLAASTWDEDITVTVSAVGSVGGKPASSQVKFRIAPANANGSMIYWAAVGDKNSLAWLEGFRVGDDNVSQVLTIPQVQERMSRDVGGNLTVPQMVDGGNAPSGSIQCIGCHTAVPDRQSVTFHDFYPWPGVASNVDTTDGGVAGAVPSWLTPGGAEALGLPWLGMMSFSRMPWNGGQHWVVAGIQVGPTEVFWQGGGTGDPSHLIWIDLSTPQPLLFGAGGVPTNNLMGQNAAFAANNRGKSYDYLATTSDPGAGASCPTWSNDGQNVVYVSNNAAKDGRLDVGKADLYTVPFNGGAGGTAKPLAGASDPTVNEYYPWYSPDDKYVAYDRASSTASMYYNSAAEVYVVPSAGGTATRLAANDSPACMGAGAASPGVTNSWPRWSPEYPTCSAKTYYWLIFSSSRARLQFNVANMKMGNVENTSQLYLTALVDDGTGKLTSYPGVFVWNQPTSTSNFPGSGGKASNQSNHTPAWDVVEVSPPPPPPPPAAAAAAATAAAAAVNPIRFIAESRVDANKGREPLANLKKRSLGPLT